MNEELKSMVKPGELVYYEGKPDKKCFIFESIFNPLLPFALLWAIFDFGIMGGMMFSEAPKGMLFFVIPFMMFHLMPVWIYLGGVLLSVKRHQNTYYIVTDRAIYVSGGVFSKHYNVKPFAELSHINIHRGIFDQRFNVGDVVATTGADTTDANGNSTAPQTGAAAAPIAAAALAVAAAVVVFKSRKK